MICIQNNEMKYDYKIDTLHLKRRETLSNVETVSYTHLTLPTNREV